LPAPHGISSARILSRTAGVAVPAGQRTQPIPAGTPPTRAIAARAGRATILLWAIPRAASPRAWPGYGQVPVRLAVTRRELARRT